MQSNFAVHTHTAGRTITLALSGELDLVSAPALERAVEGQPQPDVELIVLDLRGLDFMDSTGLHAVLRTANATHDAGCRFALIRGPDQVHRLFELTGLAETLKIVDSPEQLLEGWTPPEPTVTP
jgi:anti-sigma B factor antagonist